LDYPRADPDGGPRQQPRLRTGCSDAVYHVAHPGLPCDCLLLGDVSWKFKVEVKKMLVELVNSWGGFDKEKFNLQFLQQLGENRRFNDYLTEAYFVDKTAMLTIFVLFQTAKKSWIS
jgi:hypothetical protein